MFRAERAPKNWIFPSISRISAKIEIGFFAKLKVSPKEWIFPENKFSQKMTSWVNKDNRVIYVWVRMWRMEEVPGHGLCTANRPAGRPARRRNISRLSSRLPQLLYPARSLFEIYH